MKAKTSVTLSNDLLRDIDRAAGSKQSRSAFIEQILWEYFKKQERARFEARELELLNRAADELTPEVDDVLRYQVDQHQSNE